MFLNFFDFVKEFFKNLVDNINFTAIVALLVGIIFGILLCVVIYVITSLSAIDKSAKKNRFNKNKIDAKDIDKEEIEKHILASIDEYNEASVDMTLKMKYDLMKELSVNLVNDIAKLYNPDSNHPMFELSFEELIQLNLYITKRIDDYVSTNIFLKRLKRFKVASVLNVVDKYNKAADSKIVKAAKKVNLGGIVGVIRNALGVLNPSYYANKLGTHLVIEKGFNKIARTILNIIGEESAKIYSKNVFVSEEEIEKELVEVTEDFQKEEDIKE